MECESECANVSPIRIGDIDIIGNIGDIKESVTYCLSERCVPLSYRHNGTLLPIRKYVTFHYSPLRGNFAASLRERQWKALRCRALTSR